MSANIIIVEDEKDLATLLKYNLSKEGFKIKSKPKQLHLRMLWGHLNVTFKNTLKKISLDMTAIEFQREVGRLEVLGELIIKND
mgnify:CR=1 FL=1